VTFVSVEINELLILFTQMRRYGSETGVRTSGISGSNRRTSTMTQDSEIVRDFVVLKSTNAHSVHLDREIRIGNWRSN
jgi:hypothetical protein